MRFVSCLLSSFLLASVGIGDDVTSIKDQSTHEQSGLIQFAQGTAPLKMNAFCLNNKGKIIAVCGNRPGEVRVVNDEGTVLHAWKVSVKPESVGVADDDSILVGGEGKLFRFAADGKLMTEIDSPHAARLRDSREALREEAIANLKRTMTSRDPLAAAKSRVSSYETMLTQLKERKQKSQLNESEERLILMLPDLLERYQKQVDDLQAAAGNLTEEDKAAADAKRKSGPSETQIKSQVESMIRTKMRVSSISSSGEHVFVTTRGIAGYGFDVWKMNLQFADADVIVTGLSGCCGQMDVQCCKDGLFVAENSRDRVVHYDIQGKEINKWGKSDRTGINGFTSCCNPMNVCFDNEGFIYTAESGSGRIKRFDATGKLISYVGDVDLVPGCKNVSIAVSPVNDKIYMLDLTRNHIKVMEPKSKKRAAGDTEVENQKVKSKPRPTRGNLTLRISDEEEK